MNILKFLVIDLKRERGREKETSIWCPHLLHVFVGCFLYVT